MYNGPRWLAITDIIAVRRRSWNKLHAGVRLRRIGFRDDAAAHDIAIRPDNALEFRHLFELARRQVDRRRGVRNQPADRHMIGASGRSAFHVRRGVEPSAFHDDLARLQIEAGGATRLADFARYDFSVGADVDVCDDPSRSIGSNSLRRIIISRYPRTRVADRNRHHRPLRRGCSGYRANCESCPNQSLACQCHVATPLPDPEVT